MRFISQLNYSRRSESVGGGVEGGNSTSQPRGPSSIIARRKHSVKVIKLVVQDRWPGRPNAAGIRLIHAGRILGDDESLADIVKDGQPEVYLHLVVRPDAWTDLTSAPLTPLPRTSTLSAPPMLSNAPAVASSPVRPASPSRLRPETDPLEGSSYFQLPQEAASQSATNVAAGSSRLPLEDVGDANGNAEGMVPEQDFDEVTLRDLVELPDSTRVLSIIYVLYQNQYSDLYDQHFASPPFSASQLEDRNEARKARLGLVNDSAVAAAHRFDQAVFSWSPLSELALADATRTAKEYLRRADVVAALLTRVQRVQSLVDVLGKHRAMPGLQRDRMAQRLPSEVRASALPTRSQMQAATEAAAGRDVPNQQPAQPEAAAAGSQRPATAVPPPSLTEIMSLLVPLFFLALKLSILLYIFTRGASRTKRAVMISVAATWILFEGMRAWARRNRRLRHAMRQRDPQQRPQRNRASVPAANGTNNASSSSPTAPAADQLAPLVVPHAPQRYTTSAITDPQFWIQHLALYGLEEEDRQLGFRPSAAQAQIWSVLHARDRHQTRARERAARRHRNSVLGRLSQAYTLVSDLSRPSHLIELFVYPMFLYSITLVPQFEELRGEEVRRRERLIKKWWTQRGSKWVEKQRRSMEEEKAKQDGDSKEAQASSSASSSSTQAPQLPRLLKHPYVLRLLKLRMSADGLVEPIDDASSGQGNDGGRINIQDELDAARDAERDAARRAAGLVEQDDIIVPEEEQADGGASQNANQPHEDGDASGSQPAARVQGDAGDGEQPRPPTQQTAPTNDTPDDSDDDDVAAAELVARRRRRAEEEAEDAEEDMGFF